MRQLKVLNLKLGGRCNLNCANCHCSQSFFEFNPKIINWIKSQSYERIVFGGGEPILYFDTIKRIVNAIGDIAEFKLVTNGTLLTKDKIEWLNQHNFIVLVSFDGFNGQRDESISPRWDLIKDLKRSGLSVCCSHKNMDFKKIGEDINELIKNKKLNIKSSGQFHHINFLHTTDINKDVELTNEDVIKYTNQYKDLLVNAFCAYLSGEPLENIFVLKRALKKWFVKKEYVGCACCNNLSHSLTLDGRFMLCSYGNKFVGDITHGIDFDLVDRLIPNRCKKCPIWGICRNTCVANVTEQECHIAKEMNGFLNQIIDAVGFRDRLEADIRRLQKT